MDRVGYYQLIPKRRSEYVDAPREVNEAAESEYRLAFQQELTEYRNSQKNGEHGLGISEADADAHCSGVEAANRIWEAWRLAAEKRNRDLNYELERIPQRQVLLLEDVNDELLKYAAREPSVLHQLTSRRFEELVAAILLNSGFDVEITKATSDGGVDIYAYLRNSVSDFLVLVECKKYGPLRPVGVELVRQLYGVQQKLNAPKSMIVTTSYFTKPAQDFRRAIFNRMELKDYNDLTAWLKQCARAS